MIISLTVNHLIKFIRNLVFDFLWCIFKFCHHDNQSMSNSLLVFPTHYFIFLIFKISYATILTKILYNLIYYFRPFISSSLSMTYLIRFCLLTVIHIIIIIFDYDLSPPFCRCLGLFSR